MENKKTYLIYIDRAQMGKSFADRIAKLGDRVFMDTGLYLVKCKDTAEEITALLTAPPYNQTEVFVAELKPDEGNIFGLWKNLDLWRFLGLYSEEKPKDEETTTEQ